jgi:nitroreductase
LAAIGAAIDDDPVSRLSWDGCVFVLEGRQKHGDPVGRDAKEDVVDTLQAIFERRSIRQYKQQAIPDEHLTQILEAGRQAPSAANRQPWHFILVGEPAQKQRVAQACNGQTWMADAAYILVALGLPQVSQRWYRVDVAIALENMVLAARSLGYGTCWIGAFDPAKLREACQFPAEMDVVACTPLGVPDAAPEARARKPREQVFSADRYGQALKK